MSRGEPSIGSFRIAAAAILLAAAALRLPGLAAEPLSAPEAGRAAFAWWLAEPNGAGNAGPAPPDEPSPLLESLHFGMALLGAEGDTAVRLPGALAGVALIGLLLSGCFGVALMHRLPLAALAAVDPTLVVMSRRQGDVALGLLVAALVLAPLARSGLSRQAAAATPTSPRRRALALGVLLASGWIGWAMIPAMLVLPWAPRGADGRAGPSRATAGIDGSFFALGLGLAATAGLLSVSLAPELSASLTSFLGHLGAGCAQLAEPSSYATLLAANPLAFGLGPAAMGLLALRGGVNRRSVSALLRVAFVAAVLVLVTRAAPESLGFATALLLVAIAVAVEWGAARKRATRLATAALLCAALVVGTGLSLRALNTSAATAGTRIVAPAAGPASRRLVRDLREQRSPDGRRLEELVAIDLGHLSEPLLDWYLRGARIVQIEGPERAAAVGPVTAALTRGRERPAEWLVPPLRGAEAIGREYRLRGSGAEPIVLWRYVGGYRED